jgi:predicted DNA-binding transcriptional regulator YafY
MSETQRLYRLRNLLSARRPLSKAALMQDLEVSPATLKRDLAKLRDQFGVPLRFDRDRGGYVLDGGVDVSELPGLWFSPDEILALVTIQQLLSQLEPGLLGERLKPLQQRLGELMTQHGLSGQDVARRIRIVHVGKRRVQAARFESVASATLARKRLRIEHYNRQTGERQPRDISPQRLVHYRDNWYVDAWCHLRDDLRSFSIDAMARVEVLEEAAKDVAPRTIDATLGVGYGIFGGRPQAWAKLRFTKERARWVEREIWHPQQESHTEADGSYVLMEPYADDRELVGDILRFGADVEVLEPPDLRRKVHRAVVAMAGRYV